MITLTESEALRARIHVPSEVVPREAPPRPQRRRYTRVDPREVERLMVEGWTTAEIAELLGCALSTVYLHEGKILRRFEASERRAARKAAVTL